MSNQAKVLRGQLRQIAKDLLPEALANEVHETYYKQLQEEIRGKLSALEYQVKQTLEKLDERSKDMQTFMMKQALAANPLPKAVEEAIQSAVE